MWPLVDTRAFLAWIYRLSRVATIWNMGPLTGTYEFSLCLTAVHKSRHAIVVRLILVLGYWPLISTKLYRIKLHTIFCQLVTEF